MPSFEVNTSVISKIETNARRPTSPRKVLLALSDDRKNKTKNKNQAIKLTKSFKNGEKPPNFHSYVSHKVRVIPFHHSLNSPARIKPGTNAGATDADERVSLTQRVK